MQIKRRLSFLNGIFGVIALGMLSIMACANASDGGRYGERMTYAPHRFIQYPDFRLIYLGKSPQNMQLVSMGDIYKFQVTSGQGDPQVVTWSAGTGDIGPAIFNVHGQCFALEMHRSDTLGRLKDDELVITSVSEKWCNKEP